MLKKMLAYCGIDCGECPVFIGTQTNNQQLLAETAKNWSTPEHQLRPEDLVCDGCTADQRLVKFCAECQPRRCAREHKLANCGWCDEYPCAKLTEFWEMFKMTEPKERLDEVKRGVK